jgi:hypothetical protein
MTKRAPFALYVADATGVIKCAVCEFAKDWLRHRKIDHVVRPGSAMEADAMADSYILNALAAYHLEYDRFPAGAPVLIWRRGQEVALDAADWAEIARKGD